MSSICSLHMNTLAISHVFSKIAFAYKSKLNEGKLYSCLCTDRMNAPGERSTFIHVPVRAYKLDKIRFLYSSEKGFLVVCFHLKHRRQLTYTVISAYMYNVHCCYEVVEVLCFAFDT